MQDVNKHAQTPAPGDPQPCQCLPMGCRSRARDLLRLLEKATVLSLPPTEDLFVRTFAHPHRCEAISDPALQLFVKPPLKGVAPYGLAQALASSSPVSLLSHSASRRPEPSTTWHDPAWAWLTTTQ